MTSMNEPNQGPASWRLYQDASNAGDPFRGNPAEYVIYSNAHVTNELRAGIGPFQLLCGLRHLSNEVGVGVVVRVYSGEEEDQVADMTKTSEDWYHGGTALDELAGLLALSLGTRFRAGGLTRMWGLSAGPDGNLDPLGRPMDFDSRLPTLPTPGRRGPVLASLARTVNLADASGLLSSYFHATPTAAIAIARAARLYERAIWIADDDPQDAWLLLVSALEVGADQWVEDDGTSPAARLRRLKPALAAILEPHGEDLVSAVADHLEGQLRATWKFNTFVAAFLPPPPPVRPKLLRVDWERLGKHLSTTYGYRSRALHEGHPFPAPMCDPPHTLEPPELEERPVGNAVATANAVWLADDMPMLLNTFEYVVRHILLAWWHQAGHRAVAT